MYFTLPDFPLLMASCYRHNSNSNNFTYMVSPGFHQHLLHRHFFYSVSTWLVQRKCNIIMIDIIKVCVSSNRAPRHTLNNYSSIMAFESPPSLITWIPKGILFDTENKHAEIGLPIYRKSNDFHLHKHWNGVHLCFSITSWVKLLHTVYYT